MGVIFRYLKKSWYVILICIALLFGEAMADLVLPNYMSDIVNVGIQQGGINNATPEAITEDGMDLLTQFMPAEEINTINTNYTFIATGGAGTAYERLLKNYPALNDENIFVINDDLTVERSELDLIFGKSAVTLMYFLQGEWIQGTLAQLGAGGGMQEEADITAMYPFLQDLIAQYLGEGKNFTEFRTIADNMGASTVNSMGASFVKMFYQELGININKIQSNYILWHGFIMLLVSLGGGAASILVGLFASRTAAKFSKRVREDLFKKVQSFSSAEFDKFSTASLITRTTNDITQVQMAIIMGIRLICYAPILGTGAIIMALSKSAGMGWVIAVACIVLLAIMMGILLVALPKFKIMQKLIDKVNLVARENLSGILVVRAFGTQQKEGERFDTANKNLTRTMLFINRTMSLLMPVLMLIMNLLVIVIIWVGAEQVANSGMQVGDMMAFMQYAILIVMSVLMVAAMFTMIPRALVSSRRIAEVLNTEVSIKDPQNPLQFIPSKMGEVEFRDVEFKYEGAEQNVLDKISFLAKQGETTAIIGSTGSGKSTLINLIPRFYDVTGGEVLVNGVNVKDVLQHDLRENIGYVPQKGMMLSGTVESNLKYGKPDAENEELNKAIRIAQGEEFVNKLPEKTSSPVAAGGTNFSGGQKQRLSIARALVKGASIYIFDDSFSALDYKTDAKLREALGAEAKESTIIIVAQRVATIRNANQIIVLNEGRVAGIGTHDRLIKTCKVYKEIALSQLNKEEL